MERERVAWLSLALLSALLFVLVRPHRAPVVPADLTRLSAQNGGKFPNVRVRRYIEGLDEISAHGSRDMPIWGRALRGMPGGDAAVKLRIEGLTKHVESLQQK